MVGLDTVRSRFDNNIPETRDWVMLFPRDCGFAALFYRNPRDPAFGVRMAVGGAPIAG